MIMNGLNSPEMSVVIVTPDDYETIRKTIKHLRAQTIKEKLEIMIVAPSLSNLDLNESELREFLCFDVVEFGPIKSSAKARAAGVRRARAPVIAFVEDHSYPDPRWAEALIEAHQQPWTAVGPAIGNANPGSMTSWANLMIEYGPWLSPAKARIVDHLPGHNSTYKRLHLSSYGSELEDMLEAESLLHWNLRAKGYQLYLDPAAKTFHLNFSSAVSSIALRFYAGRHFASTRSQHWPSLRRFFYFTGSPLIPLIRLLRILRELRQPGRQKQLLPRILPSLIIGLAVDGIGEMLGYALGVGDALEKLTDMEFHRERYLNRADRELNLAPSNFNVELCPLGKKRRDAR
jgi:GT2 family glycosyltransferase